MLNFKNIHFLKAFAYILIFAAFVVTIAGATHIGYSYAEMKCMIEHGGASAPANIVLTMLIPYCLVVVTMVGAGIILLFIDHKKNVVKNTSSDESN